MTIFIHCEGLYLTKDYEIGDYALIGVCYY